MNLLVFLKKYFYLFIWLCRVLVVAHKIFDLCCDTWSKWDLVARPGIKARPLHWELAVLATGPPGNPLYLFLEERLGNTGYLIHGRRKSPVISIPEVTTVHLLTVLLVSRMAGDSSGRQRVRVQRRDCLSESRAGPPVAQSLTLGSSALGQALGKSSGVLPPWEQLLWDASC